MRIQFLREMPSTPPPERGELVCVLSLRQGEVEAGPSPALSGALVTSLGSPVGGRRSLSRPPSSSEAGPRLRIDRYQLTAAHPLIAAPLRDEGYPLRVVEVLQRLLLYVPSLALVDVVTEQPLPLQHPALQEQLGLALKPLAGGLLLAPTLGAATSFEPAPLLGGPAELSPSFVRARLWDQVQDWAEQVQGLEQLLRSHYLTGLLDIPPCPWLLSPQRWDGVREKQRLPGFLQGVERHWQQALEQSVDALTGMDVALFTWAGDWAALLPHVRRSPAALGACTLLAQRQSPALATLERQKAQLPEVSPSPASRLRLPLRLRLRLPTRLPLRLRLPTRLPTRLPMRLRLPTRLRLPSRARLRGLPFSLLSTGMLPLLRGRKSPSRLPAPTTPATTVSIRTGRREAAAVTPISTM